MYVRFSSFDMQPELFTIEMEVDCQVNIQSLNILPIIAQREFVDLYHHLGRMKIPARVKFSRIESIWSQIDQGNLPLEISIEFRNNAWTACYGDTY